MKQSFILNNKEYKSCESVDLKICEENNVIIRKDYIKLIGEFNYTQVIKFENFEGKVIYYEHTWCKEWTKNKWYFRDPKVEIYSYGRTTSSYYPYLLVDTKEEYYAINLLPNGDWRIRFEMKDKDLYIYIDRNNTMMGPCDFDLNLFIVHDKNLNDLYLTQQKYVRNKFYSKKNIPLSYNTWFGRFFNLEWDELVKQANACAFLGVETFIVDAGWFGNLPAWEEIGNWEEKENLFGNGKTLVDFADYVRSLGMNFGIWAEVMKIHKNAPLRVKYPKLFVPCDETYYHYDFNNSKALDLMFHETCKVIEKYNAKWIKIDNNNNRMKTKGDPHVIGSINYWKFLDKLQNKFPDLIIENCASGGMSLDIETISHYDTSFPSDTTYTEELIRCQKEAYKVFPPAFINNWACMYPLGKSYTNYYKKPLDNTNVALNPKDATSTGLEVLPIDYILAVNFCGNLSLTGDYANLSKRNLNLCKKLISIYKENRDLIFNANYVRIKSNVGYVYLLENQNLSECLLFVFNDQPFFYNEPCEIEAHLPLNMRKYKVRNLLTGKKVLISTYFSETLGYKEFKIYKFTHK